MKFFARPDPEVRPRIPDPAPLRVLHSAPVGASAWLSHEGEIRAATCLSCPSQACMRFSAPELPRLSGSADTYVCPTSAISFDADHAHLRIDPECIGCGLCVLRCPFGALYMGDALTPRMPAATGEFRLASPESFEGFERSIERLCQLSEADVETAITRTVAHQAGLQQGTFYPLVGKLLTAAGFPTRVTPGGDTNNRIDAIVVHESRSIPIELKSPTETSFINVKSIQQALENKVILRSRRRDVYPTDLATSSLVIGYRYPAGRSDVHELIEDVLATYGIRIGMIDLATLYHLVYEVHRTKRSIDFDRLGSLVGPL